MKNKIGHIIAKDIYDEIEEKLNKANRYIKPFLVVIQVGDDIASNIYIKHKKKACDKLKFGFKLNKYEKTITTEILLEEINIINEDKEITGCIVQLPLPDHINKHIILNKVSTEKDVDCFNNINIGKLALGVKYANYMPATVYGIYRFIKISNIETKGKHCVIIGKSIIVGKTLQLVLSDEKDLALTTTLCDKYTENIERITKNADILVVAAGKHHLINNPEFIKENAVVIDVGIHRIKLDNKYIIQGDVDYKKLKNKCSIITPVPGGVGPMTVASLMFNLAKPFF